MTTPNPSASLQMTNSEVNRQLRSLSPQANETPLIGKGETAMPMKLCKPPTPKLHVKMRALCPEIIASIAITDAQARAKKPVNEQDREWFITQAETWVRWFHANNRQWRKRLDRESNDDRDFVLAFLNHWADAFVKNPGVYKSRHPILGQ